jgi:hypothetical protein
MTGWLANNEQEKLGRLGFRINFRFYPCVCVKGLRKARKTLSNYRMYSVLRLNTKPIAYETGLIATLPWCLLERIWDFKNASSLFKVNKFGWNTCLIVNPLTPNDLCMSRTAPLTSKRCILYIYSTNIRTEYFKHALYSPFFFSSKCSLFHNDNLFGSCIIHVLYTVCAEI